MRYISIPRNDSLAINGSNLIHETASIKGFATVHSSGVLKLGTREKFYCVLLAYCGGAGPILLLAINFVGTKVCLMSRRPRLTATAHRMMRETTRLSSHS